MAKTTTSPPKLASSKTALAPSTNGITREQRQPSPKRRSEDNLEITSTRRIKRPRRATYRLISLPLHDPVQFWRKERQKRFFVFTPTDATNLRWAKKHGVLDKVVFGLNGNRDVEGLVEDEGLPIAWAVPRVGVEFETVRWQRRGEGEGFTESVGQGVERTVAGEGRPVSPGRMLEVEDMSVDEYAAAVERGDVRVARGDRGLFECCVESGWGWLGYEDR